MYSIRMGKENGQQFSLGPTDYVNPQVHALTSELCVIRFDEEVCTIILNYNFKLNPITYHPQTTTTQNKGLRNTLKGIFFCFGMITDWVVNTYTAINIHYQSKN